MKKKDQNKGFTLVELIVVLVILAILAAILVPALLGYIDQAKSKQTVLNAKSALTAAQAEMSNIYASKLVKDGDTYKSGHPSNITDPVHKGNVLKMADIQDGDYNKTGTIVASTLVVGCKAYPTTGTPEKKEQHASYTITYVEYKESEDAHLYFDGSSWNEWDKAGAKTAQDGLTLYEIKGTKTSVQ